MYAKESEIACNVDKTITSLVCGQGSMHCCKGCVHLIYYLSPGHGWVKFFAIYLTFGNSAKTRHPSFKLKISLEIFIALGKNRIGWTRQSFQKKLCLKRKILCHTLRSTSKVQHAF